MEDVEARGERGSINRGNRAFDIVEKYFASGQTAVQRACADIRRVQRILLLQFQRPRYRSFAHVVVDDRQHRCLKVSRLLVDTSPADASPAG